MKHVNQKGFSAVEGLLIVIIVGLLAGVGFYVYRVNKENSKETNQSTTQTETTTETQETGETTKTPKTTAEEYALIKATIVDNSKQCANKTANFANTPATMIEAKATDVFNANQNAVTTSDHDFARVTFGCGSQASVAILSKANDTWSLIAEDASYIMPCSKVDGKKIPAVIAKTCFANETAGTDERAIR